MNRITSGTYVATGENGRYNLSGITYDKNGNIKTLIRNGHTDVNAITFGVMDNLQYTYGSGNKLTKVLDNGNDNFGFKDGVNASTEYWYDANGNLQRDWNKDISSIQYNHLNLPTEIYLAKGKRAKGRVKYVYDANGIKLSKEVTDYAQRTVKTTKYAGNYVYEGAGEDDEEEDGDQLQFFNHPEGYIKDDNGAFKYVYQYKDHLGNVRLSYTDNNKDGVIQTTGGASEIIEESNYFPFGLKHKGYNNNVSSLGNSTAQKFKYNGVEYEESLGLNLYEMEFRSYDPAIGKFNGIDPVTHYSQGTSVAFDNNPVFWADPSGADSIYNEKTGQYVINGKVVSFDEALNYANNGGNADGSNNNTPDDIITLDKNGKVTSVERDNSFNIFFDEKGNRLDINDLEGLDNPILSKKFNKGDQVFYYMSTEELQKFMKAAGSIEYKNEFNWLERQLWKIKYAKASYYEYDFGFSVLQDLLKVSTDNMTELYYGSGYVDGVPFIRFQSNKMLYNLPDAGNFMWGQRAKLNKLPQKIMIDAANKNEGGKDTSADLRAIISGFNY